MLRTVPTKMIYLTKATISSPRGRTSSFKAFSSSIDRDFLDDLKIKKTIPIANIDIDFLEKAPLDVDYDLNKGPYDSMFDFTNEKLK